MKKEITQLSEKCLSTISLIIAFIYIPYILFFILGRKETYTLKTPFFASLSPKPSAPHLHPSKKKKKKKKKKPTSQQQKQKLYININFIITVHCIYIYKIIYIVFYSILFKCVWSKEEDHKEHRRLCGQSCTTMRWTRICNTLIVHIV